MLCLKYRFNISCANYSAPDISLRVRSDRGMGRTAFESGMTIAVPGRFHPIKG